MARYSLNLAVLLALSQLSLSAAAAESSGAKSAEITGRYACSFTLNSGTDHFSYPNFLCVISHDAGKLKLEKLSGSQRIKGAVSLTAAGFDFEGEFFCPDGDCTSKAYGHFEQLKPGKFHGELQQSERPSETISVELTKKK
jgi:hypothetical protein